MPSKRSKTPLIDPDETDADYVIRTKLGYPYDEVISALQKCVRRGRTNEALYWTHELVSSGFVKGFWRRLMIIASEECSNDLQLCALVGQLARNAELATKGFAPGSRQEGILEAQATISLTRSKKKSREAIDAVGYMHFAKRSGFRIEPLPAGVDMHTRRGRAAGRSFRDFRFEGRLLAGELQPDNPSDPTRNDFEQLLWTDRQPHLGRPGEDGADADIELPPLVWPHPEDPNAGPEMPADWLDDHERQERSDEE